MKSLKVITLGKVIPEAMKERNFELANRWISESTLDELCNALPDDVVETLVNLGQNRLFDQCDWLDYLETDELIRSPYLAKFIAEYSKTDHNGWYLTNYLPKLIKCDKPIPEDILAFIDLAIDHGYIDFHDENDGGPIFYNSTLLGHFTRRKDYVRVEKLLRNGSDPTEFNTLCGMHEAIFSNDVKLINMMFEYAGDKIKKDWEYLEEFFFCEYFTEQTKELALVKIETVLTLMSYLDLCKDCIFRQLQLGEYFVDEFKDLTIFECAKLKEPRIVIIDWNPPSSEEYSFLQYVWDIKRSKY